MIIVIKVVIFLLLLLFGSSYPAFVEDDLLDFLEDQGLQELSAGFVYEEIEVGHLPSIPDNLLVQLGVKTMGSRLNLRTAATAWLTEERSQVQDSEREQVRPFSDTWEFASRDTPLLQVDVEGDDGDTGDVEQDEGVGEQKYDQPVFITKAQLLKNDTKFIGCQEKSTKGRFYKGNANTTVDGIPCQNGRKERRTITVSPIWGSTTSVGILTKLQNPKSGALPLILNRSAGTAQFYSALH